MNQSPDQTHFLARLQQGDPDAAAPLWQACVHRIMAIARKKLGNAPRRISDEEDIAVSAFNSFCQGAKEGRFQVLENRQDLWNILAVIVTRKANRQIEFLNAQKRGPGRVRGDSVFVDTDQSACFGLDQLADDRPAAEMISMMEEEFESLLNQLYDQQLRKIALLKLEGYSNQEIADQLGRNLRSIERKLNIIRGIWQGDLS